MKKEYWNQLMNDVEKLTDEELLQLEEECANSKYEYVLRDTPPYLVGYEKHSSVKDFSKESIEASVDNSEISSQKENSLTDTSSTDKDIFDKVSDYIDKMSDEEFINLVKDCEKNPEINFAIANNE